MAKQKQMDMDLATMRALTAKGVEFKIAGLYQVLGPHYRDIIWLLPNPANKSATKHPYRSDTHTHRQIAALLNGLKPETKE